MNHALCIALVLTACEPVFEDGALSECDDYSYEPVAWQAATPLDRTAEQVFAGREQSCDARVDWGDVSDRPNAGKQPQWGQSTLTVSLTLDPDSARVGRPARSAGPGCDTLLAIEGNLEVRSDDGKLAVIGRVELDSQPDTQFGFWSTIEDEAEGLKGDGDPNFQFWVVSMDDCVGSLTLTRTDEDSQRRSTLVNWMAAEPD